MPSQENGIAFNITPPNAISVASSTNTSPIQITAVSSHGMQSGDAVHIVNHQTNTAANGIWQVQVTGANSFLLLGSTGTAAGGSTGFLQPITYGSTFSIPSDGDPASAASANAGFDALADRTCFEFVYASGSAKLSGLRELSHIDPAFPAQSTLWLQITPSLPNTATPAGASGTFAPAGAFHGIIQTDIIEIDFDTTVTTDGSPTSYAVSMWWSTFQPGTSPSYEQLAGASKGIANTTQPQQLHIGGFIDASLIDNITQFPGHLQLQLYGSVGATGGGQNLQFYGDYLLRVKLWRNTKVPQ